MTSEAKKEFTLRISGANKSELIAIMYEMFDVYVRDGVDALNCENYSEMHRHLSGARKVLSDLIGALNYEYEISGNLLSIYRYVERQLIKGDVGRDDEPILQGLGLMNKLSKAFHEVARLDESQAVMKNAQPVYAGMTYGRNTLSENSMSDNNRGFLV